MVGERRVSEDEGEKIFWKKRKVREKLKIEIVQTSSRTSLREKVSREFFKSEKKKKSIDSPSSMEALALCTSLSTVFLNSFDSLIRICALNTSPNFGFPSNAIFSSAVRSSGCFISAATAIPASAENRSYRLADQLVSSNVPEKFHHCRVYGRNLLCEEKGT